MNNLELLQQWEAWIDWHTVQPVGWLVATMLSDKFMGNRDELFDAFLDSWESQC